jgi:hypothetical protein
MAFDQKGRALHGRIEFFQRSVHKLTKHLTTIVQQHKEGVEAEMKFSERLKDVAAQEPFADLQDRLVALSEFTERRSIERKRIMCDRAESYVLEKLQEVQQMVVVPSKALLKDRERVIKALVKAEGDYAMRKEQGKLEAEPIALVELRHCLRNTEKVVDNNMELFEAQRIEDLKEILEEFIRCEMYYHCRALEVLAPALNYIKDVDSLSASDNLREELRGLNQQMNYN